MARLKLPALTVAFRASYYPAYQDRNDGDTVYMRVFLAMLGRVRVDPVFDLRLLGLDCPEKRTPEGQLAKQFTLDWIANATANVPDGAGLDWPFIVELLGPEKYGRSLARVWRLSDGHCLNDDLLAAGQAVPMKLAEQRDA